MSLETTKAKIEILENEPKGGKNNVYEYHVTIKLKKALSKLSSIFPKLFGDYHDGEYRYQSFDIYYSSSTPEPSDIPSKEGGVDSRLIISPVVNNKNFSDVNGLFMYKGNMYYKTGKSPITAVNITTGEKLADLSDNIMSMFRSGNLVVQQLVFDDMEHRNVKIVLPNDEKIRVSVSNTKKREPTENRKS